MLGVLHRAVPKPAESFNVTRSMSPKFGHLSSLFGDSGSGFRVYRVWLGAGFEVSHKNLSS